MKEVLEIIPKRLEGTSVEPPLEGLHRIYRRIDREQSAWIARTPYRCPPGCGSCCDEFEPDLLEAEALYLAAWVLRHAPDRLEYARDHSGRRGCVLAAEEGEYHCTAYEGRPLVCRLFAFSGDRGKDGGARFRPCARMPFDGKRSLSQDELMSLYGLLPPLMGDLAGEASALMPDRSDERLPLREALPRAAAKLRMLSDLAAFTAFAEGGRDGDNDGDNDNPGGNTPPLPRAG